MVPCYEGVGFDACGGMRKDLRFLEWGWRLQAIFRPLAIGLETYVPH